MFEDQYPPTPPRRPIDWVLYVVLTVIIVVLGWLTAPQLARLASTVPLAKAADAALAACPPPTESEQLHVVVTRRDGTLVAECMFVGPTGAYVRRK